MGRRYKCVSVGSWDLILFDTLTDIGLEEQEVPACSLVAGSCMLHACLDLTGGRARAARFDGYLTGCPGVRPSVTRP